MLTLCVYDVEVLPNCFICCCKVAGQDIITFEISERRFHLQKMVAFFRQPGMVFVGYNCIHYDTPIMNMLIMKSRDFLRQDSYAVVTDAAYKLSSEIISGAVSSWVQYKYARIFKDIDLMTLMASKALRVGLKSLQVTMCYVNVKEMRIKWSAHIEATDIDSLTYYCHNDVGSTTELLKLLKDDLKLRQKIEKEFNIDCLSKDGVGIGVDIFTKFVCQQLNILTEELDDLVSVPKIIKVGDYIQPCIQFKTKPFQDLLEWYKKMELSVEEASEEWKAEEEAKWKEIRTWEELEEAEANKGSKKYKRTVTMNNLSHAFALGGIHSVNKPTVYVAGDGYILRDEDVESYYPSLALAYGFGPDGFKEVFLAVMKYMKDERVVAKAIAKDKTDKYTAKEKADADLKNEAFKLALNSILGNLKNEYSAYFAPHMNVAICVNGQLMLAMLIEECELAGIECISSNTDGATFRIHDSQILHFEEIRDRWQVTTMMKLETALYEKMVIYAVNDYIAFKVGYSDVKDKIEFFNPYDAVRDPKNAKLKLAQEYVKEKGMFITVPRLGKGLDCLIIPKAVQNYFGKDIPVNETIKEAKSIWDFIRFQKVGKQYKVLWNEEEQQHINRFYVSKKGAFLYKAKKVEKYNKKTGKTDTVTSLQNMLKGFGVQLMNEYQDKPMNEYNIDYRYYTSQANQIIEKLDSKQHSLF